MSFIFLAISLWIYLYLPSNPKYIKFLVMSLYKSRTSYNLPICKSYACNSDRVNNVSSHHCP